MRDKRKVFGQQLFSPFKKPVVSVAAVVLLILVFSTLIAVAASRSTDAIIQNSGRIVLVGLDAHGGDINPTSGGFSVDLGEIQVGRPKSISFYLRSVSNVPITLAFSLNSREPRGIESFFDVSWTYNGTQLAPKEEIPIRIDISTAASADFVDYVIANHVTYFSFSLSIYAIES